MNKNTQGRFFGALAILAVAPHVHAQQAPRCSDLYDDAQRLACYDAAFGKPTRSAAAVAAPRAPTAPAAPATVPAPTPAPAVRTAPAPVAPATPAAEKLPKNVSAAISEVGRRADGRFVVTLDNGQVWSQLERDMAAQVAIGDAVTVRQGMLGSYILITRSGVQTKVKSGK